MSFFFKDTKNLLLHGAGRESRGLGTIEKLARVVAYIRSQVDIEPLSIYLHQACSIFARF